MVLNGGSHHPFWVDTNPGPTCVDTSISPLGLGSDWVLDAGSQVQTHV